MPWITTKTGKHINTDWLDKEISDKDRQIDENKKQADKASGKLHDPQELIPENSYTKDSKYVKAKEKIQELLKEKQSLGSYTDLYEEYEKEKDKYIDAQDVKLLGRQMARMLVSDDESDKLQELRQKIDNYMDEEKRINEDIQQYSNIVDKMDEENSKLQKSSYSLGETKPASGEYKGFETSNSTTPYIDDLLKKGKASVVEMSPKDYIKECAYKIFNNSTIEKTLRSRIEQDKSDSYKYAQMMREGVKFNTPYINYRDGQQEGLHRAVAAYINGYEKIPVIIVRKEN